MPAPNLWAFILSITLFTLGIDSSFSMLEACATVMQDSPLFRKWPRKMIALFLVILGSIGSIFFSFNWGFTFFEVVDNYLNTYLMLVLGILETMGAAWVYEASDIFKKGRNYKMAVIILASGYWIGAAVIPCVSIFADTSDSWIGLLVFWPWLLLVILIAYFVAGVSWHDFKSNVLFYGVRKLSRSMTKLSKTAGDTELKWWEPVFEYWWGFSIKYFVPWALSFLVFFSLYNDTQNPYGKYHIVWQCIGFVFPIAGLFVFVLSFCICSEEEPFDHDVDAEFNEDDHAGLGAESSMAAMIAGPNATKI